MTSLTPKLLVRLALIGTALALAASACGGGGGSGNSGGGPVSGNVLVSGSSTVEPISVRVAELIKSEPEYQNINVNVDGPGTGDGFKLFCTGETDISDASRPIKPAEQTDCANNGVNWVELWVGIDGIAVMTNSGNDAVDCLNFNDLYAMIGPEANGTGNWSQAQALASELGSTTNLPDLGLDVHGPGEESGTFDSFVELVLEDIADEREQEATTRTDYSANADDNLILQGIKSDPGSLGWVGFAHAVHASDVKILQIEGAEGCVEATPDTIAANTYPISRSLYIYVNIDKAEANPAVAAYVDYYMAAGLDAAVSEVGYVTLTEGAKIQTRNRWDCRCDDPQDPNNPLLLQ